MRDNKSMFHYLFEHTSDAVWLLDALTATFVDCNDAAVALMRCGSRADLVGKRAEELAPPVQSDGLPTVESMARHVAETLKNGKSMFEWTAQRFDGTKVPLEVNATAIERDGNSTFVWASREITARKAAEAVLLESEARFRTFFERNADAMSLFDPQTLRYIEANEAVARLVGAPSREALRNVSPTERWPERQPDGRLSIEKVREMIKIGLDQGSHRFEWLVRRYDGTELPLDIVMTAVPFGGRTLISIVYRDVSAQKQAESEIRQLNASLEKRVAERTDELLRSNDQLKRVEQELRKRGEQVQKHRDVLLELAHSDKSDFLKALRRICLLAASTLDVARVSYWSVQKNRSAIARKVLYLRNAESFDDRFEGSRLFLPDCPAYFEALSAKLPIVANDALEHAATSCLAETYLKPFGISSMLDAPVCMRGELVGVLCHEHIGLARDWSAEEIDFVSALASSASLALEESNRVHSENLLRKSAALLRESEARFCAAFRASPALISLLRLSDGRFVEVNDAFVSWLGLDRERIVGHDTKELGVWLNRNEREKILAKLLRKGSARQIECQFRSCRGTVHTIVLSAEIIEINCERHILGFGLDITERKQAETELLRTLAREKELGQLRSNFVSMVSHEIRTPLGIIQSSAEILEDYLDQLEPSERKEHLQSIRKNTRRMAGLMEEVLLIGSLEEGKMEYKPAVVELRTFVRRLVEEVLSTTGGRCPIELSIAEVPVEIRADKRLLRHIFTNLLINAVKYSHAGWAVRFEIRCAGSAIVCAVQDQGIGIPEVDREWLFNAFYRGRNVGDRPGTGLGLLIVKRCVDLHGGKIRVESQLGEGTVVTVRLPI
jgi:PAS domain S-box-containing protein